MAPWILYWSLPVFGIRRFAHLNCFTARFPKHSCDKSDSAVAQAMAEPAS
jgi:hypothetical protein